MNLKERSNESKLSSNYNLNVCTASKGSPQDELNTNKHQFLTVKKVSFSWDIETNRLVQVPII